MSVQKDPSGRRFVQVEVEVPGTPEEVWQAIATGEGVSSWFVPTELREDGTVVSKFGPGMEAVARQTAWDPPHRFAAEGELGPGAPKMATEWIVEARSGGTCVVRVVHSLFASTDDWDNQLENIESGWPWFFQILRLFLTHHRGQKCAAFRVLALAQGSVEESWKKLTDVVGLTGATAGQSWSTLQGIPALSGKVERTGAGGHPSAFLLRLDGPVPGTISMFAHAMGGPVCLAIDFYLYGEQAATVAQRDEPQWNALMSGLFPALDGPMAVC